MISIWEKESFYKPVDIIIIGSGLMGLWTAYELACRFPKLDILIIERGEIPNGASTRNAGFACFGSPTELLHDISIMGIDAMLELTTVRYRGIKKMRHVLGDNAIGFEACGGYECVNSSYKNFNELSDKIEWLNTLLYAITGSPLTFKINNSKLPALGLSGFDSLIENPFEGALHSGLLVKSLMQLVKEKGVQIMMKQEAIAWQMNNNEIELRTKHNSFKTKKLILATNGFTNQLSPAMNIEPARGQIIVTKPIEGLKLKGTFHYNEGFYYWRHLGDRVLLGGARNIAIEEEKTDNLQTSVSIQKELEFFLIKHILKDQQLTANELIEHRWAGLMGFTEGKKPQIKQIENNVWSAISCNGMGVALIPITSEQLATSVLT